tara:strand:- start:201 stop:509 length:309 start_codon:yes stop_codon:yes gene_type:complete
MTNIESKINWKQINEVDDAISEMDDAEIDLIVTVIKTRREMLSLKAKARFRIGDRVTFFNKRRQEDVVGTVHKINRKKIVVSVGAVSWTVPPTMLSVVKGAE